ncbi:MAG TPA: GAF domain-containing protein [Cyanobacteria bacterium UBA8803]|nr:GAF domain-containing protein [Cyanobacteria bacterium UBA9273]HBL62241.1 GAF domain-containing protein [Cyanobacteria bacterium UBA8803]
MDQQYLPPQNDHQLVALGRVLETLREEENADVLIDTTIKYLESEFNYRLIWIGLYDRLEHQLFGKGGIAPTADTAFLKQRFNLQPGDLLEQVVIQQRPVAVPNLQQDLRAGEWRRVAEELGIQGTILYPLRCKDRCFGVTLLGSHHWGISQQSSEKAQLSSLLGGLAAALYQIEVNWQRSALKHPAQPLFEVLRELMQLPTVALRLDKLVSMTQEFVAPTRTNLYWYSPERRYFWHRVGSRQTLHRLGDLRSSTAGLMVAEATDFYQALAASQLVTIGAGRSILKAESTERLLKRLRTRSLLAAPIQAQGELLGFLSVEDNEARIWEEAERKYVRASAQLMALVVGHEQIETTLERAASDTHFAAEIARVMAQNNDTEVALKDCAKRLFKRLDAECFIILQPEDNGQFNPVFCIRPPNRRPLTTPLAPLEPTDQQWLSQKSQAAMIEDLEENLRLVQWREPLSQLGVRSLLICQISLTDNQQRQPGLLPLLVIGHGTPRTWNHTERDLVASVAYQINLLLTLGNYSDRAKQSFLTYQTLQAGLSTLWSAPLNPIQFERTWVEYVANVLECPLATMISWTPQSDWAAVTTAVVTDPHFALPPDPAIPVTTNTLIQDALATTHFLCRSIADLPLETRQWLNSPAIGQVLAIALHRGTTPATEILLLADREERHWPDHLLPPLEALTQQFIWFRYYRHRLSRQEREGEDLQTLNWYKHRCLDMLHQSVQQSVSTLLEIDAIAAGEQQKFTPSPLQRMRRQQLMRQLEATLSLLTPVLKQEQWQLTTSKRQVPLASLLKRSLRRVEPLYHQRQILLKVHSFEKFNIYADLLKLECILFELLLTSCLHAQPGTQIHLWCHPIYSKSKATVRSNSLPPLLELLIAECDSLEDCQDALKSSPAEPLPLVNLKACQQILRSWGGDLHFYPVEANRSLMQLVLPLIKEGNRE